ncbi:MAG: phosphate/phosphite/phosphonate ABC transporter substrate-binding protein [Sulfurimicrobium sp.]|nr:phosphate/phosphite/phosphonate ABC transporter substrate-binding protein [Sulfurimicrobium sp.]MDZ7657237.1 phosphate/phosphite/phosphonate ABC transporter substrate-binding protein [Sulfurimicrobium sp.]
MKNWLALLSGLLFALTSWTSTAAAPEALRVGLFPNLSTRLLLETYQPMRDFLEHRLGRPVTLFTAPDFNSFVSRTQSGEYDLIVTAPHFARLAQTESGYQPLFSYRNNITAAIVVAKNSRFTDLNTLRGQKIAAPDRIAVVTMLGLKMLRNKGMEANKNYHFHWAGTHGNVALAVLNGEAAAGIIGMLPLKQLPENVSQQLHVLSISPAIDSQMILAHQRVEPGSLRQIREALVQFEKSPAGQEFFRTTSLVGLKPLSIDDLKQLDPYAREVRRMLELPR